MNSKNGLIIFRVKKDTLYIVIYVAVVNSLIKNRFYFYTSIKY